MRRLAVVLLVLSVHGASVTGARPQDRPLQADPVVQLLADLESALSSGRADDFRALASPSLPAEDAERIRTAIGSEPSQATVRRCASP